MSSLVIYQPNETTGTATVILNRSPVNALNPAMQQEVIDAFRKIRDNDKIRRVVLKAGDNCKNFCVGVDIFEMGKTMLMEGSPEARYQANLDDSRHFAAMLDAVASCGKPMIGIVNRAAVGVGATLVTLCDYVVATEDAQFKWPEWHMGLKPSISAPYVAARIGPGNAIRHFIHGEAFGVDEAKALGMVNATCAPAALPAVAQDTVRRFEAGQQQFKRKSSHRQTLGKDESHPEMYPLVWRAQELYADRSKQGRTQMINETAIDLADSRCTDQAQQLMRDHMQRVGHHEYRVGQNKASGGPAATLG